MQDSEGQANHLQILATSGGRDVPGFRPHVEVDAALQPWHQEMCALVDDALFHSLQSVEDHSSCPAADIVDARLQQAIAEDGGHCKSRR